MRAESKGKGGGTYREDAGKRAILKRGRQGRPHREASQDLQEVRVSQLEPGGTLETEGTAAVRP